MPRPLPGPRFTKNGKRVGAARKTPPADAAARVQDLAANGATKIGIAHALGVGIDVLGRWFDEDPGLVEAFVAGRERERLVLHNVLYRAATEGTGKDALIAAMFLLKARHGYREGDQQEQANRVSINFQLPGAQPLDKFTVVENDPASDRTQRLSAAPAVRS